MLFTKNKIMKLDLNKPIIGLDRKPMENSNIGRELAPALAFAKTGDALKLSGWADKLYNGEEIELDKSDLIVLEKFIKEHPGITNLLESQILLELKE